jgi:hypothetical protein
MLIRQFQYLTNPISLILSRLKLKVLNENGIIAKSLETSIKAGNQDYLVNVSDLSSGNYVLNAFYEGGFLSSLKFVKQ